jgi:hypothetical protein
VQASRSYSRLYIIELALTRSTFPTYSGSRSLERRRIELMTLINGDSVPNVSSAFSLEEPRGNSSKWNSDDTESMRGKVGWPLQMLAKQKSDLFA